MIDDLITDQTAEPVNQLKYGITTTAKHGSGWISVYNVLFLLSQNLSPAKVIRSIEEVGGASFEGLLGTKYSALIHVLSEYGFLSRLKSPDEKGFSGNVAVGGIGILVYHTPNDRLAPHYTAFQRISEDRFDFYNPTTSEHSVETFLRRRDALNGAKLISLKSITSGEESRRSDDSSNSDSDDE